LANAVESMETRKITKADFDEIVQVIDRWWGGPISTMAHPIFFYELGENALIAEKDGRLIGFLLGFIVFKAPKTGYVHLVGIHPDFRRQGVGRILYERFTEHCRSLSCLRMKAITTTGNEGSIRFHQGVGWTSEEVEDYAGPDRKRIVFTKELG
jgi:GNAT superfamily N-acetyltransferase